MDDFRATNTPAIELDGVYQVFTGVGLGSKRPLLALQDVHLTVSAGEFVTLLGPSGCGKSTILNLVAGLLSATRGEVVCQGRRVTGPNVGIGYVTQDDNLMPWRTAAQNIQLGLEYRGVPPEERQRRSRALLERVGLAGFEGYYPHQLSGGMRKRVGIARTLILEPQVVLMDEPFGPLDAQTRTVLQSELLRLWSQMRQSVLFITHDLVESIALSDRIVVMTRSPGRIKAVYDVPIPRPRDVFRIHSAPGFDELYDQLWRDIQEEMSESSAPSPRLEREGA